MRKLLALAAPLAVLAVAGTSALGSTGKSKTIKVEDDFFSATKVTVSKGTLVTWRWAGTDDHNVTDSKHRFKSQTQSGDGKSFRYRFRKAGTYTVYCTLHPTVMRTRVTVK